MATEGISAGGDVLPAITAIFVVALAVVKRLLLGRLGLHRDGGSAGATGTFGAAAISGVTGAGAIDGAAVEAAGVVATIATEGRLDEGPARRTNRADPFEADGGRGGGGVGEAAADAGTVTVAAARTED